jgi:hypothetical protein
MVSHKHKQFSTENSNLELLDQTITSIITEPWCCYWAKNSLLKELLSNVVSTLQVARELAKCCRVLSYSWKLMKQSDLDVLVNKLNLQIPINKERTVERIQ